MLQRFRRGELVKISCESEEFQIPIKGYNSEEYDADVAPGTYGIVMFEPLPDSNHVSNHYSMYPVVLSDAQVGWCHSHYLEKT